jgi:hypothetical protein
MLARLSRDNDVLGSVMVDLDQIESTISWIASHPVRSVRIDSLTLGDSPRRGGTDEAHVRVLAEAGGGLPPITVQRSTLRVIDGTHRVRAARQNGLVTIDARIVDCDDRVAFVLAVKTNACHGLPLSHSDRAAAASRIIRTHPEWSDRAVAAATALSDKTVSRIRSRTAAVDPGAATRLGQDGRLRPLDTSRLRMQAAAILRERPEAGLREVARATGLSPATVRDVRTRLDRGDDPVPGRYRLHRVAGRPREAEDGASALLHGLPQAGTLALPPTGALAVPSDGPAALPPAGPSALPPAGTPGVAPAVLPPEAVPPMHILLTQLGKDPSVRLNDAGRHTLVLLQRWSVDGAGLAKLGRGLPDHWAPVVADVARNCAAAWKSFADELQQRHDDEDDAGKS